jgi:PHD/YefM family antitoxin component YafN of YafNO toxin-antitoxin module
MENILTAAELKRRGMAAIEDRLTNGPVHIVKRNKPAAVVISEAEYRRLAGQQSDSVPGMSAVQWLLSRPAAGKRSKEDIDSALSAERDW